MLASSVGLLILTVGVIVAFYTAVVMKTGVYWRTRTRHWFDQPPAQPLTAPRFFTPALVADFIDRATSWLSQELGRRGMLPDG